MQLRLALLNVRKMSCIAYLKRKTPRKTQKVLRVNDKTIIVSTRLSQNIVICWWLADQLIASAFDILLSLVQ